MSKGHGRIQRLILQVLQDEGEVSIQYLVDLVYDSYGWNYSQSQYQSVLRAVRKLKEEGLVETYMVQGEDFKWLMIKISV